MLDTVLKIGKAFRESPNGLKYHRYIKPCPQDTDKRKILRLSLPLTENLDFNFDGIKEITDENIIRDRLFYLTFKTSDADGLVKFIFGDIYYSLSKGKENGYYRLGDPSNKQKAYQVSSFFRGVEDFKNIDDIYNNRFNNSQSSMKLFKKKFEEKVTLVERLLKYQNGVLQYLKSEERKHMSFSALLSQENELRKLAAKNVFSIIRQSRNAKKTFKSILEIEEPDWKMVESNEEFVDKLVNLSTGEIFLHFEFQGKQHWYEFQNDLETINLKILEDFTEKSIKTNGYILRKYLYKTLSSPEKDLQFPTFQARARYRNKLFYKIDEILDLLYAIDFSKKALLKVPYSDIKIIAYPDGDRLLASHYEEFSQQKNVLAEEQKSEAIIRQKNKIETEPLFEPFIENEVEKIIKFDLIFSKQGGQTSPDIDMVEVSGLEKSTLSEISKRIGDIKRNLYDIRQNEISFESKPFSITWSFLNILSDSTSGVKKYQSHLLKVLPKIYTGTYYQDPILLPALIQKTEENIRNMKSGFKLLKYDFIFLVSIQNTKQEGGNLVQIKESQSYKIGLLLGELARQFAAWRDDCPMKSFEKSYVGTLSRRISTLNDLTKFKIFIEEKLILHERTKFTHPISVKLAEAIKEIEQSNENYDKNKCAFGFFEAYFASSRHDDAENAQALENEKVII